MIFMFLSGCCVHNLTMCGLILDSESNCCNLVMFIYTPRHCTSHQI